MIGASVLNSVIVWHRCLASFMREVDVDPSRGGKRSDARRLQDQRLLNARMDFQQSIKEEHRHGERRLNMEVAPESELWWNPRDPQQGILWGSYIVLGEYFEAITALPVPADMRVLRAIKHSPWCGARFVCLGNVACFQTAKTSVYSMGWIDGDRRAANTRGRTVLCRRQKLHCLKSGPCTRH
jgi:hypothetical protein